MRGCKGDRGGAEGVAAMVGGMVLILSREEGDPVGLKIDVSKENSSPSCKAIERTEGDGLKIDDS